MMLIIDNKTGVIYWIFSVIIVIIHDSCEDGNP